MKNKNIILILILTVIMIVALSQMKHFSGLKEEEKSIAGENKDLGLLKDCSPTKTACVIETVLAGKKIKLLLSLDSEVQALTKFPINLQIDGKQASNANQVKVSFSMPDMDMGENSLLFQVVEKNPQDNLFNWQTQGMLPMCPSGGMDWIATIHVSISESTLSFSFPIKMIKS